MLRTAALLSVLVTACGTDPATPDNATHTASWHCDPSGPCESPLSAYQFAAISIVDQAGAEVMALAWTIDGDGWISHTGSGGGGEQCWQFDAGVDDGVGRDAYSLCESGSTPNAFVGGLRWGDSRWSVTLLPIER
jgi:hypothetical protein